MSSVTSTTNIPQHVAIIMDGNGRWAKQRHLPRSAGHKAGVETVRKIVKTCYEKGISTLSLFAFGKDNWRRPNSEVSYIFKLFLSGLNREAKQLHKNNIKLIFIGDRDNFAPDLKQAIEQAELLTKNNTKLQLIIAIDYCGQWDILQAAKKIAQQAADKQIAVSEIDESLFNQQLLTNGLPEPDLLIRTSGMQRISNFFLWQLAYTELYFTETMWPDFSEEDLQKALQCYANRARRFGFTDQQIAEKLHNA